MFAKKEEGALSRREFVLGSAAALAADPARSAVTMGRAKPLPEAVTTERLSPAIEKSLVGKGHGTTNMQGAAVIRDALDAIARTGPQELRALAAEVRKLLPTEGIGVQVDRGNWSAHGAVELSPMVRLRLFDGSKTHGMTYGVFLHEALHAAVAARYRSLSVGMVRENDAKLGMPPPAAARAMDQFRGVWGEFKREAVRDLPKDGELRLALEEAIGNPDEFFVRALTDPAMQKWMAEREYSGKTLWDRFKDWVRSSLLGFKQEGTKPSWLDAAMAASDDVLKAMPGDKADFERVRAINRFDASNGERRSEVDAPDRLAARREPERKPGEVTREEARQMGDLRKKVKVLESLLTCLG